MAALVHLKVFQRLGYFLALADVPQVIRVHVAQHAGVLRAPTLVDLKRFEASGSRMVVFTALRRHLNVKPLNPAGFAETLKSPSVFSDSVMSLQQEIADKLEISRVLKEKLNLSESLTTQILKLDDPVIKELPERYALKGESNKFRTNLTGIEFMKLEEAIGGTSPVLATDKVAMTIKNSATLTIWIPRSALWCSARQIRLTRKASQQWQGRKIRCAFHRNCYSYFGELIMKMRCLAQEHGYTLGNVGVMIYRIDITLTGQQ